ncbi:hypothetical protein BGW80DRAFT_1286061 [Lactifluus volemus]|nr:hypothetical protein BGW80DRAFT_1286061 [Lactifluus volemus]
MPTLTPSYLPPSPPKTSPSSPFPSLKAGHPSDRPEMSLASTSIERDADGQRLNVPLKRERELNIPSMRLDMPVISEDMAASLAVALLGHVLFLKSQVPFPVAQLGRVPGASSVSRAAKKRADMITTFDELSSHLHTTFSALSTALARNKNHASTHTAYLALVLGPTIGAPKARVILALEGLEVKIWGERAKKDETDDCSSSDDGSEASGDSFVEEEVEEDTSSDVTDTEESPISPPASEAPSPSPSPPPEVPSPQSSSAPAVLKAGRPLRLSLSPKSSSSGGASQPYLVPQLTRTYAEEQQTLRAAERLLARTLVNAYAEGGGIAAELAPTQTHVLLRAPRRFSHPAWLPRQNISVSLDSMLQDFLIDSGLDKDAEDKPLAKKTRRRGGAAAGIRTEGVLVSCQTGARADDEGKVEVVASALAPPPPGSVAATAEVSEEDELIWWAWDGKLTGFAEW